MFRRRTGPADSVVAGPAARRLRQLSQAAARPRHSVRFLKRCIMAAAGRRRAASECLAAAAAAAPGRLARDVGPAAAAGGRRSASRSRRLDSRFKLLYLPRGGIGRQRPNFSPSHESVRLA